MSEFIYCPYCGARNASTNKFCENCGQKISDIAPSPESTTTSSGFPPYSQQVNQGYMGGTWQQGTTSSGPQYGATYKPYAPPAASSGSYDAMRPPVATQKKKGLSTGVIILIVLVAVFGTPIFFFLLMVLLAGIFAR